MDLSVAAVTFALTRRAAELGASAMELGLLGSVMFGSYTLFALAAGQLSDRWGRRPLATIGSAVAAITAVAFAFSTSLPVLLAWSILFGAGIGGFWPTAIAWLGTGARGAALSKRLARFSMAWNLGLLLGFALTGIIFRHSPQLAFYVAGAGIVLVIALLLLPVPPPPVETGPALQPVIPKGRGFRKTAWLANFGITFALTGVIAMFPQLATSLDIPADRHGLLLACGRMAALLTFWILQHLQGWRTRLWPLWVAQAVVVLALAGMGWFDSFWLFALALACAGAVSGYTYQASIFFTLEETVEQGKGSGFHEAVLATGLFLGPLLAGIVGQRFSLRSPYFFCAGALAVLIGAQLVVVFLRRNRVSLPA